MTELSKLSRERLDALVTRCGENGAHLAGIIRMIRDYDVQLFLLPQISRPLCEELALARRPFIALIGDDTDRALGPDFFDISSLDQLFAVVEAAALISGAARADVYDTIGSLAALYSLNVLIVETRSEQEIAWTKALQRVNPHLPTIICTVETTRQ